MCHCAFQQQVLQSKKQASTKHLKSIDISNWLVEKSGRNHAPFEGLKICKGWNSCHTHNISHVRSLHLGKLGWMSGTSFNTLSWIYQSINLSTLISHKKSRGYGNKKMIINMSTNCRNKMKSEDLCQGVETAAEKKTSAHDRFKWRAAPVPLHGICHHYCFSIAWFFLPHLPSPPFCQLCTWHLIIRRQQLQRWLLHSKNQTVYSMRTCPLVKIHHWSCWSSMEFNHMQWPRVVLFCWWGQWCQHNESVCLTNLFPSQSGIFQPEKVANLCSCSQRRCCRDFLQSKKQGPSESVKINV